RVHGAVLASAFQQVQHQRALFRRVRNQRWTSRQFQRIIRQRGGLRSFLGKRESTHEQQGKHNAQGPFGHKTLTRRTGINRSPDWTSKQDKSGIQRSESASHSTEKLGIALML